MSSDAESRGRSGATALHAGVRRDAILLGMVLGALAGFLLSALGFLELVDIGTAITVLMLVIVGGILGAVGWQAVPFVCDLALLALYVLVAFTPLIETPATRWIRNDRVGAGPYDAVVVLSGSVSADSTVFAEAADRLVYGLSLIRAGASSRLVTTRVDRHYAGALVTSDSDQAWLIRESGLNPERLIVASPKDTHDEATGTARLLGGASGKRIVVVTSPMHTRRACAVFEKQGFTVTCVAARIREFASFHPIKPGDRLREFGEYLYERLGMIKYRAKGWIA